ncbi:MAG: DUF1538 domain-containing protein [Clostridiaceae bacterium]|nr:DUF1538 domain-containing protein [Clostridiaceae bacterium]
MRLWTDKLLEVVRSVFPIAFLVLVVGLTVVPLDGTQFFRFFLGTLLIVVGMTVFLVGVDLGVTPAGSRLGEAIIRRNRAWIVVGAGLLLGFLVSVAEPDLHILADQVESVTAGLLGKWDIVLVVSVGIAALLVSGLLRILYGVPTYLVLTGLYMLIFILSLLSSSSFLAIAFDASGATTGAMTVPFILAMALGIAQRRKDGKASEKDSFGLVGIASAGAILAVLVMGLAAGTGELAGEAVLPTNDPQSTGVLFISEILHQMRESVLAISPIFAIVLIAQPLFLKMRRRSFSRLVRGFGFAYVGLVLFFTGVNAGFMEVGREIGSRLAMRDGKLLLVGVGFVIGLLTILAEPAVHVLTRQIEEVTSGSVRRQAVFVALCLGVGIAVGLSVLRILLPGLQLWHILLPGYAIALVLAHLGSKLFVGMAFDAGGVASGPMTATFVLAFAQGAADAVHSANVLIDGFGVIALVALTPIITLQVLGILYRRKTGKKGGGHIAGQ